MDKVALVIMKNGDRHEWYITYIRPTTGQVTSYDPNLGTWHDEHLSNISEIIFPLPE